MSIYQIKELALLAHISKRTLRYYDEIGILSPKRIKTSDYRVYDSDDLDRLQEILFYRELGVDLKKIKALLSRNSNDRLTILKNQLDQMVQKKHKISNLIKNLTQTIDALERNIEMKDKDKFQGFKEESIRKNDDFYKDEVIETWGKEAYASSKKAMNQMTEADFKAFMDLGEHIKKELKEASDQNLSYQSDAVQQIAKMHQQWLKTAWGTYNKEAHLGIVNMYESDERFKMYYDKEKDGLANLLKEAVTYMLK